MNPANPPARQPRLFVLELDVEHPYDLALGPGRHELRDLGVRLDFDGLEATAAWLGHGPTAFLLPGVRALRVGEPQRIRDGDRLAWAGRSFALFRHDLDGEERAPPRGVCKNPGAAGHPLPALLLCVAGPERGNFYRVRSEALELAPGAFVRGVAAAAEGAGTAEGGADPGAAGGGAVQVRGAHVRVDGDAAGSATAWTDVPAEATLEVQPPGAAALRAVVVRLPSA